MRLKIFFITILVILVGFLFFNAMMTIKRRDGLLSPKESAQVSLNRELLERIRDEVVTLREKIAEYGDWESREKRRNAVSNLFENTSSNRRRDCGIHTSCMMMLR